RHDLRPRRRTSRQQYRLHQPGRDVLDPLWRTHGDGGVWWHGLTVRSRPGHHRFPPAGRSPVAIHRILGADHGPAVAADRAVRARRHHGRAREVEPWLTLCLIPCSALKTWSAASVASRPPTTCRSTFYRANCTPS